MTEEKKENNNKPEIKKPEINSAKVGDVKKSFKKPVMFGKNKKSNFRGREKDEFDQRILDIARVTRVMAGGKRMRFRACVAVGDKKGKVGIGLGKGADVTVAINKAVNSAKKDLVNIPIVNDTIPHEVYKKIGAAKILLKPARKGRGIIAGGVVRVVLELSGIKNITSKILGTNNKVNNAKCVIQLLKSLKRVDTHKKEKDNNKN